MRWLAVRPGKVAREGGWIVGGYRAEVVRRTRG